MEFIKTLDSTGETLGIVVGYQDGPEPNLGFRFSVTDCRGMEVNDPTQWSAEIKEEYAKIRQVFKSCGFENCSTATVKQFGNIDQQVGLEHPGYKTQTEMETIASLILTKGLGFETPLASVEIPREGYAKRKKGGAIKPEAVLRNKEEIDWKALEEVIEDEVVKAYGTSGKSMELVTEIMKVVKAQLGTGKQPDK